MKYILLLLIFITHLGYSMSLKSIRNEILKDDTAREAMDKVIEMKKSQYPNMTHEDIVDKVLLPIAAVETGNKYDPKIVQRVENPKTGEITATGPGKGLYQFEPEAMKTALIRASRHTKNPFVSKHILKKDFDATKLSVGQQSALALYDFLEKPNADIGLVINDQAPISTFWEKYHWAGHKKSSMFGVMKKRLNFQVKNYQFNKELEDIKKGK